MGNRETLGDTDGFECDLSDSRRISIAQRQVVENVADQRGINLGEIREVGRLLWGTRENASAMSDSVVGRFGQEMRIDCFWKKSPSQA
jgi:hypothetical protein